MVTKAQQINPLITYFDEHNLNLMGGSVIVNDVTAHSGAAIFRASSQPNNTIWFGPYRHLQAGHYLFQFRMKVSSNLSAESLFNIDVFNSSTWTVLKSLVIKPNLFKNPNEWELITISVQVPNDVPYLEIRGMNFVSGISDVYLDYINILSGSNRGNYSDEFSVTNTGNVGIGTMIPDEKLTVKGKIHAEEVRVDLNIPAPDYVFESDYSLKSLEEVDNYVKLNKHLPDIPSGKRLTEVGINLSEMNMLLLKKVEELTLHLINLNEKTKNQESKILRLENEIQQLKIH